MAMITANDLKTKGLPHIETLLQSAQEVIISVRGKPSYVVMDIAHYERLREQELEAVWLQVREDVAAGRYQVESAEAHVARIQAEIQNGL